MRRKQKMTKIFELHLKKELQHLEANPKVKRWLKSVENRLHKLIGVPIEFMKVDNHMTATEVLLRQEGWQP